MCTDAEKEPGSPMFQKVETITAPKRRYTFLKEEEAGSSEHSVHMASLPRRQHFVTTVKVCVTCRLKILDLCVSVQRLWVPVKLKIMIQKSQNENKWPETRKTRATKNQITETSCTCKRCVPSWCTAYVKCAVLLHIIIHLFPTRLIKMNIISFNVCQTAHRSKSYVLQAQGCCENI
jgi:hypothetical protein